MNLRMQPLSLPILLILDFVKNSIFLYCFCILYFLHFIFLLSSWMCVGPNESVHATVLCPLQCVNNDRRNLVRILVYVLVSLFLFVFVFVIQNVHATVLCPLQCVNKQSLAVQTW